jgi:hypothetical protein
MSFSFCDSRTTPPTCRQENLSDIIQESKGDPFLFRFSHKSHDKRDQRDQHDHREHLGYKSMSDCRFNCQDLSSLSQQALLPPLVSKHLFPFLTSREGSTLAQTSSSMARTSREAKYSVPQLTDNYKGCWRYVSSPTLSQKLSQEKNQLVWDECMTHSKIWLTPILNLLFSAKRIDRRERTTQIWVRFAEVKQLSNQRPVRAWVWYRVSGESKEQKPLLDQDATILQTKMEIWLQQPKTRIEIDFSLEVPMEFQKGQIVHMSVLDPKTLLPLSPRPLRVRCITSKVFRITLRRPPALW